MGDGNVISILITAKNAASAVLHTVNDELSKSEEKLDKIASGLGVATAALVAFFGISLGSAVQFSESMTNVAAVLGQTREEQAALSAEILDFGATARAGPQAVAAAYYDIVGGVADATTHMAILQQATAVSEAGNAQLTSTTAALISVMNSYKFSADQASFASDVLTRTVQVGVGTMEDFATALPMVTGLANSLGISFDELGASAAYLTTQGFSASIATTQLRAMMTALLNPNEKMNILLRDSGFATGQAAIQSLGLAGAYKALQTSANNTGVSLASAAGSVEALNGAIALSTQEAANALGNFNDGLEGATSAAREIQMASPAAQMDLFKSSIEAMRIEIGNALIPALNLLIEKVRPVISVITEFAQANPVVIQTIFGIVAALGAFVGWMTVVQPIIGSVRAAMLMLNASMGPLGIIAMVIAGMFITNFGGVRDIFAESIMPVIGAFGELMGALFELLAPLLKGIFDIFSATFGAILTLLKPFIEILVSIIQFITDIIKLITGDLSGAIRGMPTSPAMQAANNAQAAAQRQFDASRGGGSSFSGSGAASQFTNQSASGYNIGGTVPGTGVTYTDPDQAYKVYLAALQNGGSSSGGNSSQYQVNVQMPPGVLSNPGSAESVGKTFGGAVAEELRRLG